MTDDGDLQLISDGVGLNILVAIIGVVVVSGMVIVGLKMSRRAPQPVR